MTDAISNTLVESIKQQAIAIIASLGLPIDSATINAIATNVAATLSTQVTTSVTQTTNYNLNTIPADTYGPYDSLNLVTQNLSADSLSSSIINTTLNSLSSDLTNQLVYNIQKELQNNVSPELYALIDFASLAFSLLNGSTSVIEKSISSALSSIVGSLFDAIDIPQVTFDFNSIFGSLSTLLGLENVIYSFTSSIADKYLNQAQNFNIYEPRNLEKLIVLEKGFIDPVAEYPSKQYDRIPETNKLAQGDPRGTIVGRKMREKMTGAKLPNGEAFDQPEVPYKAEYPYNKVTETESGHVIEIDDTPGAERLHVYHRTGTFVEIDNAGSVVRRTKGSLYEIVDRNGKIAISGSADVSVVGECRIFVGNNAQIEVEGNTTILCHNDITAQAGGNIFMSANEQFNISSNVVNIQAYEEMHLNSNLKMNLTVDGDYNLRSNTNIFVQTENQYETAKTSWHQADTFYRKASGDFFKEGKNIHHKASSGVYSEGQNINQKANGSIFNTAFAMYEKISGSKYVQTDGNQHYKAGGNFNVDASQVYLNSGTASNSAAGIGAASSQNSAPAEYAGISNIGIWKDGRKDIVNIDIPDPPALSLADNFSILVDEETASSREVSELHERVIQAGFATRDILDIVPNEEEKESPSSSQGMRIAPDETLKTKTELPGNFNLSPNFTLQMLTWEAAITKDEIPINTEGVDFGEIVYNLQAVALNILEPAYNVYPNLMIASGYRLPENSIDTSLHSQGKCVDVMFRGSSKEEVFDFSKRLAKAINYDQLILHYCTYTDNAWLHISYDTQGNRKQTMTFWNNEKYGDGLSWLKITDRLNG